MTNIGRKRRWKKCCFKAKALICIKYPLRGQKKRRRQRKRTQRKRTQIKRTSPNIRIRPTIRRYFSTPPENVELNEEQTFPADQFADDSGETVDYFPDVGKKGYHNLFINGVMQAGDLYNVSEDALTIQPTGETILAGTPVIIESVKFRVKVS